MRKHRTTIALVLILALAFGLRFWGAGWGMPFTLHSDEPKYLPKAVRMLLTDDPNPHYFENPPLLTYLFFLELLVATAVGQVFHLIRSAQDIGTWLLVDPTLLYVAARGQMALLGTGTVALTYVVAKRVLDPKTALAGAFLLAVAFLHVRDSHYAVNDIPATFLLMVSVYFATRIFATGKWREYLLAGAFLGLAVATKYNAGLGAVAIMAAHLLRCARRRDWSVAAHIPLVAAGAVSLLAFIAGNPYSVLDFRSFTKDFSSQYGWTSDPYDTTSTSMALEVLRSVSTGFGPAVLVAAALGMVLVAVRDRKRFALLAPFPAVYLGFFLFGSSLFYARFGIPAFPFIAIFAGYAIVEVASAARRMIPARASSLVAVALLVLVAVPSLALDVRHDSLLRGEDTRLTMGRWLEENVPPGSKIAIEGYSLLDSEGRQISPKGIKYSLGIFPSLRMNDLDYYRREKFDYIIASSYVYGRYTLDADAHGQAIDFYRQIDRDLPVVASFSPTANGRELPFLMDDELTPFYTVMDRERPGPTVKVYRVGPAPSYGVEWLLAPVPESMAKGQKITLPVRLRNAGNVTWSADSYTPVRMGYRWVDQSGKPVAAPDVHSPLPGVVEPGGEVDAHIDIVPPSAPGTYTLRLDMVQENFGWFSARGAQTRDFKVRVE